jgi:hypothetical protein
VVHRDGDERKIERVKDAIEATKAASKKGSFLEVVLLCSNPSRLR